MAGKWRGKVDREIMDWSREVWNEFSVSLYKDTF